MSNKISNSGRRKLFKLMAAGSGMAIAGKSLPENWSKPIVESVLLPAHAETSSSEQTLTVSISSTTSWSVPANTIGSISIVAFGAAGSPGLADVNGIGVGGSAGNGGTASASVTLAAGTILNIIAGAIDGGGAGGNPAGNGASGGAGGGATEVSYSGGFLRAAGGGGGAGSGTYLGTDGGAGGAGGAGQNGSDGLQNRGSTSPVATGGIAPGGGGVAPLGGGATNGADGAAGQGGGGAGGNLRNGGGGGGGGDGQSTGVFAGATIATSGNTGAGYVEITYTVSS